MSESTMYTDASCREQSTMKLAAANQNIQAINCILFYLLLLRNLYVLMCCVTLKTSHFIEGHLKML